MPALGKLEGDRNEVGIRARQLWTEIEPGMGGIPAWKLNDFNLAREIEGDEMTRDLAANKGIDLRGAWIPIAQVVHRSRDPVRGELTEQDECRRQQHSQCNLHERAVLPPG